MKAAIETLGDKILGRFLPEVNAGAIGTCKIVIHKSCQRSAIPHWDVTYRYEDCTNGSYKKTTVEWENASKWPGCP